MDMVMPRSLRFMAVRWSVISCLAPIGSVIALLCSVAPALWSNVRAASALQSASLVVTVSAASYANTVAPESIVAAFGAGLASEVKVATTIPLPTALAGTVVKVNGEAAPLFFVSPNQINYLIPAGTPAGIASVVVTSGDGKVAAGTVQIATAAPALFTADASGSGPLAAQLLRLKANGQLIYEPLARNDGGKPVTSPIEFGDASDQLFLVLYLTGLRQAAQSNVRVNLGGVDFAPLYAGPSGGFVGLDQINVSLPRDFGGRGKIALLVRVNGAGGSNSGEFEISAATSTNVQLQLDGSGNPVLPGEEIVKSGSGFAGNLPENQAQIIADDGTTSAAEVLAVTSSTLKLRVPFGAGTGRLRVSRGSADASVPISVRTSISGIFRLTADGTSWTPINQGLTNLEVTALFLNGALYAGTNGGGVFISHNSGESWMAVNNNLPATLNVFAFAASGRKVYLGSIYGVFVTEDEGQTWRQSNAGLLETYVSGLIVSGEQLFASTVRGGIFVSQILSSGETSLLPQDCSNQPSLRSLEGKIPTTIEFINESAQTRRIYWLNYSGQLVLYNILSPGQRYVQGTFVTHPWVVTDATDQCLGIYLPLRESAKALLR
jgi:uncharacterized protein (TIGR03437 family)